LPGDRSTERELHKRFARFNKDREWFVDSPEIRAYILENTTLSGIPQGSIAVRISKTQYEAVRALARKRGVLISWLLTKAIARYLGDQKDGAQ